MTPPPAGWADHPAAAALAARHRLRAWESIPWALALAFYFVFPKHLGFGTELLVTTLFAISLDLVLGYAGIVTLGHAAFFGAGAYTVGMLAKLGIWNEPLSGLILAAVVAAAVGLGSGLVLLRTHGLTLVMLTLCTMALLGEAAQLADDYTGRLNACFVAAVAYMVPSDVLPKPRPTAWQLGLGLLPVVIALFARNGILGIAEAAVRAVARRGAGALPSEASERP